MDDALEMVCKYSGDEAISKVGYGVIYFSYFGRNAWHSTWIQRYHKKSSFHKTFAGAAEACEEKRTNGSCFHIIELPVLILYKLDSSSGNSVEWLYITQVGSQNPLSELDRGNIIKLGVVGNFGSVVLEFFNNFNRFSLGDYIVLSSKCSRSVSNKIVDRLSSYKSISKGRKYFLQWMKSSFSDHQPVGFFYPRNPRYILINIRRINFSYMREFYLHAADIRLNYIKGIRESDTIFQTDKYSEFVYPVEALEYLLYESLEKVHFDASCGLNFIISPMEKCILYDNEFYIDICRSDILVSELSFCDEMKERLLQVIPFATEKDIFYFFTKGGSIFSAKLNSDGECLKFPEFDKINRISCFDYHGRDFKYFINERRLLTKFLNEWSYPSIGSS